MPAGQCLGFPGPPPWSTSAEPCEAPPDQLARYQSIGNRNWLGTDDQGRDVLARLIYGFRISVLFGLLLTIFSSIIGVTAGRRAGLFRRARRPRVPALPRDLVINPLVVRADHHLVRAGAGLLDAARRAAAVPLGLSRRRGARRVPARAQFRIHHRGAGAGPVQRQDHVQASAAERHGGDADVPALQAVGLDHSFDGAWISWGWACRPARRRWASCWRRARPTCRRHGWDWLRSSRSPGCSACSSLSARPCAMRSIRARHSE